MLEHALRRIGMIIRSHENLPVVWTHQVFPFIYLFSEKFCRWKNLLFLFLSFLYIKLHSSSIFL